MTMMTVTVKRGIAVGMGCAAVALASSGCVVDVDDDPLPPPRGTLTVVWTVDNSVDPRLCDFYAIDPLVGMNFELVVYDSAGGFVREEEEDCRSFGVSLWLYPGFYQATATMVDPISDVARSTSLPLDNIRVLASTDTRLDLDFPPDSFLP